MSRNCFKSNCVIIGDDRIKLDYNESGDLVLSDVSNTDGVTLSDLVSGGTNIQIISNLEIESTDWVAYTEDPSKWSIDINLPASLDDPKLQVSIFESNVLVTIDQVIFGSGGIITLVSSNNLDIYVNIVQSSE